MCCLLVGYQRSSPTLESQHDELERKLAVTRASESHAHPVLRHAGVLEVSQDLSAKIEGGKDLTDRVQEAELRCGAVVACERILEELNKREEGGWRTCVSEVCAVCRLASSFAKSKATVITVANSPNFYGVLPRTGGIVTARGLDFHLWSIGKNAEYRPVARHATKDTSYY